MTCINRFTKGISFIHRSTYSLHLFDLKTKGKNYRFLLSQEIYSNECGKLSE